MDGSLARSRIWLSRKRKLNADAEFERFYLDHVGFVHALARRLGGGSDAIDDLVQEVFVTAHRRFAEFDRTRPAKPWLVGITRKVAFRVRRGAMRRHRKLDALAKSSGTGAPRCPPRTPCRPNASWANSSTGCPKINVRSSFSTELEGYTGPEIAERLGINVDTAYSRIKSVRRRFTARLARTRGDDLPHHQVRTLWLGFLPRVETVAGSGAATASGAGLAEPGTSIGTKALASTHASSLLAFGVTVALGVGASVAVKAWVNPEPPAQPKIAAVETVPESPPISASELPAEPAAPIVVTPLPVTAEPSRPRGQTPSTTPVHAEAPRPRSELTIENELIDQANDALREGNPRSAFEALDRHAQQFPSGQLATARAHAEIRAHCALGNEARARRLALAYSKQYPDPVLLPELDAPCD